MKEGISPKIIMVFGMTTGVIASALVGLESKSITYGCATLLGITSIWSLAYASIKEIAEAITGRIL